MLKIKYGYYIIMSKLIKLAKKAKMQTYNHYNIYTLHNLTFLQNNYRKKKQDYLT